MRLRSFALLGALLAAPAVAQAQPIQGFYIGLGGGYNLPASIDGHLNPPTSANTTLHPDGGPVAFAEVGYGLGNGFRFEIEGNFRQASIGSASGAVAASGKLRTYGVMANVLFDMDIGMPWLYPYIGGGVGYARSNLRGLALGAPLSSGANGSEGHFAYQAIAGLSFPIPNVPGLTLASEYRFYTVTGDETFGGATIPGGVPQSFTLHQQHNHSFLLAVRYAFGQTAPATAAAAPAAAPAPAVQPARSYLVFFDWDKATLTDRAKQIIKEAADNSTHVQYTRIEVNGYTDTSGTPKYNQGLSIRRASAVKAELIKDGVPAGAITTQGFGETHLLVPTADGVREPQNRRVEIIIR